MSTSPITGRSARPSDSDTLTRLNRIVTFGRLVWVLVVLGSGGIGTGIGFLIGEGSARATFAAQYETHDKRLASAEAQLASERIERAARDERDRQERARDLEADRQERAKIIEKIGLVAERMSGVEGSLTTIKETLRRRQ